MTLPGVSVLYAAFAHSVAGAAIVTGNVLGAALALGIAAMWFALSGYIAYRNAPAEVKK